MLVQDLAKLPIRSYDCRMAAAGSLRVGRGSQKRPIQARGREMSCLNGAVRGLFEGLPIGLLEVSNAGSDTRIITINAEASSILGADPGALVGRDLAAFLADGVVDQPLLRLAELDPGSPWRIETTMVRSGGERFPARVHALSLGGAGFDRPILAIEDITAELRARSRLAAADAERLRIAHELHDTLVQDLAAIRLRSAVWKDWLVDDPERLRAELDLLSEELGLEIDTTRRVIFDLRPAELDEAGFERSLRDLVDGLALRYGLPIELLVEASIDGLPGSLELPLLRLTQEALTNVGQHAAAERAWVRLDTSDPDRLRLEVRDDGQGFGPEVLSKALAEGHYGVLHMAERAEAFGGHMVLDGLPDGGTRMSVEFPRIQR